MGINTSTQVSSLEKILGFSLATFSMFILGYTATRVYLSVPQSQTSIEQTNVIPHQAALWSELGR